MKNTHFSSTLIRWYQANKRSLPWRETKDPYAIWLSEIILQQTKVNQGLPYYHRFIDFYPDIFALSNAEEGEILRLWQGLGYYSRARNLHKCAKILVKEYNGVFPTTYKALLKLPGVGKYTAAAIASIAHNEPVPVVDGNVFRVLSRKFAMFEDISNVSTFNLFFELSSNLLHQKDPGTYNQALMELGATVCHPKNPNCPGCPFMIQCLAKKDNLIAQLPVKSKKVKKKTFYFYYFVLRYRNSLVLYQRRGKGIWENMFEFVKIESKNPLTKSEITEHFLAQFRVLQKEKLRMNESKAPKKHLLTHQTIFAEFIEIELEQRQYELLKSMEFDWYEAEEIDKLAKPILISNYLNERFF